MSSVLVQPKQNENKLLAETKSNADIIVLATENESLKSQLNDANTKLKLIQNENMRLKAVVDQLRKGNKQKSEFDAKCKHEEKSVLNVDSDNSNHNSNDNSNDNSTDKSNDNDSEDEIFEVEEILNHKFKGRQRQFLIKWVGYDSTHNSWVGEKNLSCSKLLKTYLSKNIYKK